MKTCKILAGPNGSGKSAYFRYACDHAFITENDGPYLCGDDAAVQLKQLGADLDEDSLNREAHEVILKKRVEFMNQGISFVYETVCSHPSHLDFFKELKRKGYTLSLVYIATDNSDINVSRVAKRVKDGGHNVPIEKIKARYNRCLQLYPQLFKMCDEALIFDNSSTTLQLCLKKTPDGKIEIYSQAHNWALENTLPRNK